MELEAHWRRRKEVGRIGGEVALEEPTGAVGDFVGDYGDVLKKGKWERLKAKFGKKEES